MNRSSTVLPMEGTEEFEAVFATYESFVLGYSLRRLKDDLFTLVQTFANSGHRASVRSVARGGRFVASGSSDETIQVYNMQTRKEMGSLMKHDGTVGALRFFEQSHLFSASDDGSICVWDTGSWQCLKTLKGHKQAVNDIAVHPSGKLLLSVSRDKALYTWNLVKGRPAFITNIKVDASRIEWCPSIQDTDDQLFVVVHNNSCDIYSSAIGGLIGSIDFGRKISDLTFIDKHLVLSGEEGKVNVFDLSVRDDLGKVAPSCVVDFNADSSGHRVKCVAYGGPSRRIGWHRLVAGTSEGVITVWDVKVSTTAAEDGGEDTNVRQLAKTSAGCRLTACAVFRQHVDDEEHGADTAAEAARVASSPRTKSDLKSQDKRSKKRSKTTDRTSESTPTTKISTTSTDKVKGKKRKLK